MFGQIKIDKNDQIFSKMIRERDKRCVLCGDTQRKSECSHFWGRGHKSTRFDGENAEYLCFTCHMENEGNKQGKYREYKLRTLGKKGYEALEKRTNTFGKYGAYGKDLLHEILKRDYKDKRHLEKDWKGYQLTMDKIIVL